MTTKADIQNFSKTASDFLTGVGKVIVNAKQEQIKQDVLNKYQQAKQSGKLFFNEDGSPRTPFEINADYQQLINVGNMLGDKSLTEGLVNDYKMQVGQLANREENKMFAHILEQTNPKIFGALKNDISMDYTKIPVGLLKEPVDAMAGKMRYNFDDDVAKGDPKYGQDSNKWYINKWKRNKFDGTMELITSSETAAPNVKETHSYIKSSSYSVSGTPTEKAFKDKDGVIHNTVFKNGQYYENGKPFQPTGMTPISENNNLEEKGAKPIYKSAEDEANQLEKSLQSSLTDEQLKLVQNYMNSDPETRKQYQEQWDALAPEVKQRAYRISDLRNPRF